MSLQALVWALEKAPVKTATQRLVLLGLANHADPDGTDSFPAVATLENYTCLSRRSVQSTLRELEDMGLIRPGNPDIARAKINRQDRVPNVYDLMMNGAQSVHPVSATGRNLRPNGAQSVHERGAPAAPEPVQEPIRNQGANFPDRCPNHQSVAEPPNCWACKSAREQNYALPEIEEPTLTCPVHEGKFIRFCWMCSSAHKADPLSHHGDPKPLCPECLNKSNYLGEARPPVPPGPTRAEIDRRRAKEAGFKSVRQMALARKSDLGVVA